MSLGEMFLSPTVLSIPFPSLASEIRNNMKYLLFYLVVGLETATPVFFFCQRVSCPRHRGDIIMHLTMKRASKTGYQT